MSAATTLHAGCLVIGESGVLILGPSGAGKSRLALALVTAAELGGRFARLVADDRVLIEVKGRRLLARPHRTIAGKVEMRGLGILTLPHEPATRVSLVVELVDQPVERMPEHAAMLDGRLGLRLPHLMIQKTLATEAAVALVLARLDQSNQ